MGGGFARPALGTPGAPGARVHVAALFSARQTGARNPARARKNSVAGRLLEPEPDRERRGAGRKSGAHARALRAAGCGVEGVSFRAGTGRGGEWARLLAARNRHRTRTDEWLAGVHRSVSSR